MDFMTDDSETKLRDPGEAFENTNTSTTATMTTLASLANMVILSSLLTIVNFSAFKYVERP